MASKENRRIIVTQYSTDFRRVTKVVGEPVPSPGPHQILVQNHYLVCLWESQEIKGKKKGQ